MSNKDRLKLDSEQQFNLKELNYENSKYFNIVKPLQKDDKLVHTYNLLLHLNYFIKTQSLNNDAINEKFVEDKARPLSVSSEVR